MILLIYKNFFLLMELWSQLDKVLGTTFYLMKIVQPGNFTAIDLGSILY